MVGGVDERRIRGRGSLTRGSDGHHVGIEVV